MAEILKDCFPAFGGTDSDSTLGFLLFVGNLLNLAANLGIHILAATVMVILACYSYCLVAGISSMRSHLSQAFTALRM
jgi:hypothetical protein